MDYWTHLALGRAMWAAQSLQIVEPFLLGAVTAPAKPESWAFELLLYGAYRWVGHAGICLLVASLGAAVFWLLWRWSWTGATDRAWVGWTFVAAAAYVCRIRLVARPEMFGYLLAAGVFPLAYYWPTRPRLSRLWLLGSLLILWYVLHATWIAGAAVAALCLLTHPRLDFWKVVWLAPRGRFQVAVLGAAAVLCLPIVGRFAWRVVQSLLRGESLAAVTEMQPMWAYPEVLWPFLGVMGAALWLSWGGREGRLRRLVLWCAALALGLVVARNVAIALMFAVAPALDGLGKKSVCLLRVSGRRGAFGAAAGAALLVLFAVRSSDPRWGVGVRWDLVPRQSAEFVKRQGLRGPVFNSFDIGGYLNWAWAGDPPTFVDGRVMGENTAFAELRVVTEAVSPQDVFDRRAIQTILIRTVYADSGRLFPLVPWLLQRPDWRLVNATDALVFTRSVSSQTVPLEAAEAWRFVLREAAFKAAEGGGASHLPFTEAIAWVELGDFGRAKQVLLQGLREHPGVAPAYEGYLSAFGLR